MTYDRSILTILVNILNIILFKIGHLFPKSLYKFLINRISTSPPATIPEDKLQPSRGDQTNEAKSNNLE
jgi:hypothetical protein